MPSFSGYPEFTYFAVLLVWLWLSVGKLWAFFVRLLLRSMIGLLIVGLHVYMLKEFVKLL
jgi:hypothetical protein